MKEKKAIVGWDFVVTAIVGLLLLIILGVVIYLATGEGSSVLDKIKNIL